MEGLANLGLAIVASTVLGVAGLLIIYKMIDEEMPVLPGAIGLFLVLLLIAVVITTDYGLIQALILVLALAGMSGFAYVGEQLEKSELRRFEAERLIQVYNKYVQRPDNISAVFEIARRLYQQGMKANAIGLASAALNTLSKNLDPLTNKSFRDAFRSEEMTLKSWNREASLHPDILKPIPCPNCGTVNPLENLICKKCGRPYVMDIAHNRHIRPKVYGKLILTFGILSAVIVGSAEVGLVFSGLWCAVMLVVLLGAAGLAIHWMFRVQGVVE